MHSASQAWRGVRAASRFDDLSVFDHQHAVEVTGFGDVVRNAEHCAIAPKLAGSGEKMTTLVAIESAKWLI